jgi:hypothetical protein
MRPAFLLDLDRDPWLAAELPLPLIGRLVAIDRRLAVAAHDPLTND